VNAGLLAAALAGTAAALLVRPPPRLAGARFVGGGRYVVVAAAAVASLGVVAGALRPAVLVLVALGAGWAGHRLWRSRADARARTATRERVLETCDLLAAELGAGQPAESALVRAAEAWPLLTPVARTTALGGDVPSALRLLSARPGAEGLALVAAAWVVAHRTGHGLADALSRLAESLRRAAATDRVVQGELASARATARLVGGLPVVALAMGAGSGGDPVGFLLGTPVGLACLAGGLLLGFVGLAWIERIAAGVGS
jgi:tight adherence protein B